LASVLLAGGGAAPASAAPTFTSTFHATDRFTANPLASLPDGDFVQIAASVLGTSTSDAFASLSVVATQGMSTVPLSFFPFTAPIIANPVYLAFIPFAGAPTGSWSITATDSMGTSAPALTPPIAAPQLIPFVTGVTVSDASTTPTVSWSLPGLAGFDVDQARIRIIDAVSEVQLFTTAFPTATTSFLVPPDILQPGGSYIYRVSLEDLEFDPAFGLTEVVPEPTGLTLGGLGALGLLAYARRWRKRAA
jgi:hypothetical protein